MLATLRQRDFSLLWFAGLISISGNWMLSIALPVAVYTLTGSTLAVGGMMLALILPGILFGSLAGVFVDRWERRRTLVVVNLLLALSILPLILVRSADALWIVYLVSFVQSTLSQFFTPAENAMLPLLSDPKLLVSANALNALNNNLARLMGPAIGGLIAGGFGLSGVVIVDLLTYLIAALLSALISVTSHPGKAQAASTFTVGKIASDWLDGMRLIWRKQTVRALLIFNVFPAIGESVMSVLFIPFVTQILHEGTLHVGGLMSAQAVGGIIGGIVISKVAPRFKTRHLLSISAILFGIFDLALFNYSTFFTGIFLAYFFILIVGPVAVGIGASYNTLLQTNVDTAYQGRVFGTLNLTSSLFMLVGIAVAGYAGDRLGIVPVINVQGYVYVLAGILCLLTLAEKPDEQAVIVPEFTQ